MGDTLALVAIRVIGMELKLSGASGRDRAHSMAIIATRYIPTCVLLRNIME